MILRAILCRFPPSIQPSSTRGYRCINWLEKGRQWKKPPRAVTLHANTLVACAFPHIDFEVCCSKGTYIRSLARDMAESMGTVGHLTALRRIETTGFHVEEALTLSEAEGMNLEDLPMIAMPEALTHIPSFVVTEAERLGVMYGNQLAWRSCGEAAGSEFCRVLDCEGRLIAMVESAKNGDHHKYCCVFNA